MLRAQGASEVCIYLAAATSNREKGPQRGCPHLGGRRPAQALTPCCKSTLPTLSPRCAPALWTLGQGPDLSLDKRLEAFQKGGQDPDLAALYFTFGRYLILSGSRVGSSPLNLQGIWNQEYMPFWDSKYTININIQMNYWPCRRWRTSPRSTSPCLTSSP